MSVYLDIRMIYLHDRNMHVMLQKRMCLCYRYCNMVKYVLSYRSMPCHTIQLYHQTIPYYTISHYMLNLSDITSHAEHVDEIAGEQHFSYFSFRTKKTRNPELRYYPHTLGAAQKFGDAWKGVMKTIKRLCTGHNFSDPP